MKISPRSISYLDNPVEDWSKGIDSAETWQELFIHGLRYSNLFPDAFDQICTMGESGFEDWKTGLARERNKLFAGEEWSTKFANIIIPELAMQVNVIASTLQVPWGLAFRQCVKAKFIKISKADVAKWKRPDLQEKIMLGEEK